MFIFASSEAKDERIVTLLVAIEKNLKLRNPYQVVY